jgi:hypothetical protein
LRWSKVKKVMFILLLMKNVKNARITEYISGPCKHVQVMKLKQNSSSVPNAAIPGEVIDN